MCVMEVKPGQHHSTITQACAHNVRTVVSNLDMFTHLSEILHRDEHHAHPYETR